MTDDLVKRLRTYQRWLYDMDLADLSDEQPNLNIAADRIEAQATEIERLRDLLGRADAALRGANMNMNVIERKIRAALAGKAEQ